jgi:hypothetical protein
MSEPGTKRINAAGVMMSVVRVDRKWCFKAARRSST